MLLILRSSCIFLCNNIQPFSKRTLSILSIFFLFSPLCVFSLAFCITSYDITTINFHSETIKHTTTLTPSLALFLSLSLACMYVQKLHCINAFLCIISDSDEKLRRRLLFFFVSSVSFYNQVSEWVSKRRTTTTQFLSIICHAMRCHE